MARSSSGLRRPPAGVELARAVQRMQLVAAADMGPADEDLRDGHAPMRAIDHLLAELPIAPDTSISVNAAPLRVSRALAAMQ